MSSTPTPFSAAARSCVGHVLDGADVETARRLRGDEHMRLVRQLAGEHDALLVAARQREHAARPGPVQLMLKRSISAVGLRGRISTWSISP